MPIDSLDDLLRESPYLEILERMAATIASSGVFPDGAVFVGVPEREPQGLISAYCYLMSDSISGVTLSGPIYSASFRVRVFIRYQGGKQAISEALASRAGPKVRGKLISDVQLANVDVAAAVAAKLPDGYTTYLRLRNLEVTGVSCDYGFSGDMNFRVVDITVPAIVDSDEMMG